jgi:3-polyprenyl-4-hydroxybenzoate decarboxylase
MNFANILTATHAAIVDGADRDHAACNAFPVLVKAGATIASLLRAEREGERVASAVVAARRTLIAGLRVILADNGIDTKSNKAVAEALRDNVWKDEGIKRIESVKDASDEDKTTYNRIAKRLGRLARDIVDAPKEAPNKAAVRVPSAITSVVVAQKAAGMTKAQVRAQLLAALDRAFA